MNAVKTSRAGLLFSVVALVLVFGSPSQALLGGGDDVKFSIHMPSEVNIETVKTIAILPVQGDDFHRFNDSLRVHLADVRDDLTIISRTDVSRALVEAGIDPTMGLMIEENQLKTIGTALGADVLVYGTINDLEVSKTWEEQTIQVQREKKVWDKKKGKYKKKTVTKDKTVFADVQEGIIDLSLRVFNVGTGQVLIERNLQKNSTHTRVKDKEADKKLRKKLPSTASTERALIQATLGDFSRLVIPYRDDKKVKWNGDCKCKKPKEKAKKGNAQEAQELLTVHLEKLEGKTKDRDKKKGKDKQLEGTYYNLGLVAEMQGDLPVAQGHYQNALEANKKPKKETKQAAKRVEKMLGAWQAYYAMGATPE